MTKFNNGILNCEFNTCFVDGCGNGYDCDFDITINL